MRPTQEEHRLRLMDELRATDARLATIVGGIDENARMARPANGGWSVAEVLEHLCISHDPYLERIRGLIARDDAPRVDPTRHTWKPTLAGGLLANSLRSSRKLPAPRSFAPGPAPRPDVIEQFQARDREVAQLLERAAPLDWRVLKLRSPISSLIGMNLGDAFTVLVVHTTRHVGQIERVAREHRTPAS